MCYNITLDARENTMNEKTPIVWVTQDGNNDYSAAEYFGTVRFITKSDLTMIRDSKLNKEFYHDLRKFLMEYLPGADYIIPAGNPMVVAAITLALGKMGSHQHNFLKWDRRNGAYSPFTLSTKTSVGE